VCAKGTGHRPSYAVSKDATSVLKREECAGRMGQKICSKSADMKTAQIKLEKEECVLSMGQSANCAAVTVARTKSKEEESVGHTAASHPNVVPLNAKITPSKEECVRSMEEE